MRRAILLIPFLTLSLFLHAQEKLNYELNGKNIEFTISQEEIYVEFIPTQKIAIKEYAEQEFTEISQNSAIIKMTDTKVSFQEQKQNLQSKFGFKLKRIEPVLVYRDGTRQIAKGELNIKLKPNISINEVLKEYSFDFQQNKFEKNLYLVSMNLETAALFNLVSQLQSDKRIEFIEPNFIRMIEPHTNDPFFSSQWSINNQGYFGGTVDADMDVDDAWAYTTGTGVIVAVIDEGVDLSHPDLTANILNGYDATGNGSNGAPNETTNDAHGTSCAGIIAAVASNTEGTAGIAYDAKILPVRIAYGDGSGGWVTNDNWIANGINWAWQNGADVLSNSYGGGSYSLTIENAINNAVNNGRNGKGSVVLFSSGNDNGSVSFPASVNNAIAVGASSMCDERKSPTSCDGEYWWGSNYGTSLDVVAPGVKIYTTDISGSAGYSSGEYKSNFNGTSSACPNAAGVVALILSANPNLTQQEAREILERSVDKVSGYNYSNTSGQPNGTWNNQVGYGRINALKAVKNAIFGNAELIGTSTLCSGSSATFTLNPTSNTTPIWNVSSNLTILSQSSNSITVKPTSTSTNGAGFVEAVLSTQTTRKNIWIGKPLITVELEPMGTNYVAVHMVGANNSTINDQSITSTTWQKISSSGGCYASFSGSGFDGLGHGNCNNWSVYAKITATNTCGTTTIYRTITPPAPEPCGKVYKIVNISKNTYEVMRIIDPCAETSGNQKLTSLSEKDKIQIRVFDLSGNIMIETTQKNININSLKNGIFILRATINNKVLITKILK